MDTPCSLALVEIAAARSTARRGDSLPTSWRWPRERWWPRTFASFSAEDSGAMYRSAIVSHGQLRKIIEYFVGNDGKMASAMTWEQI